MVLTPLEPTDRPTLRTAKNPDELAVAAILYWWHEEYREVAPQERLVAWDSFVLLWLRNVTTEEMAVVNRSLEIVLGGGAKWVPWPLNSESPVDVRALPPPVSIPIRESGEVKLEILDVMGVHRRWLALSSPHPVHPLVAVIDVRQSAPDKAHISHVKDMILIPYAASEVLRRSWREERVVTAVELNGKPLDDQLRIIVDPVPFQRRLYVDSPALVNPSGGIHLDTESASNIYTRDPRKMALPMVAWPGYRGSLLQDLWLLLTVVYGSTSAIVWTEEDGARLLARNAGGGYRRFADADIKRWRRLVVYADSIEIWYADRRGSRFVKVVYIYRLSHGRVSIDKPTWYSKSEGRLTLTGAVHRTRYVGQSRNYSHVVGCMEYWLARSFYGTYGIASLLRSESGKDGPGPWAPAPSGGTEWWKWYEVFETLMSESVNREDSNARAAALKRYSRIVEGMQAAGYQRHGRAAGNGDVVEIEARRKRRGAPPSLRFRATARFCEAARSAEDRTWTTASLFDWLGMNDSAVPVNDSESDRHRALSKRRRALTLEQVEDTLRSFGNNVARAEQELNVGGGTPGNYLRGWLRKHRARDRPPSK